MKRTLKKLVSTSLIVGLVSSNILGVYAAQGLDYVSATGKIAVGSGTIHTIKTDGTLWAWGENSNGQVGNGLTVDQTLSVKILDGVKFVESDSEAAYAIKNDNTLWAWGSNSFGQVGNGTTTNVTKPVKVLESVKYVDSGSNAVYAIKTDGTLWAWGASGNGQVGNNSKSSVTSPTKILDDVVHVDADSQTAYALKEDGTLWSWGYNSDGQVGNSLTNTVYAPVKVLDNVVYVESGERCAFAIKRDGTLWAWGQNEDGQLGNVLNATVQTGDLPTPTKVAEDVSFVSSNTRTNYAIKTDGSLWVWGINTYGQVGNGSTKTTFLPVKVLDSVKYVQSEGNTSYAIKKDGTLWGWGLNDQGQLGIGSTANSSTPVKILDSVKDINSSTSTAYALKTDGTLYAWGSNQTGQIANGKVNENILKPTKVFKEAQSGNYSDQLKVVYNGEIRSLSPILKKGTSYISARKLVVETLGGEIGWIPERSLTKVVINGDELLFGSNSSTYYFNGQKKTLSKSPGTFVQNGSTYVPLRFICEAFGMNVKFDSATNTAYITN